MAWCDPPHGTLLEPGSWVTLHVYSEPLLVPVPDLRGMTLQPAREHVAVYHPSLGSVDVWGITPADEHPCWVVYEPGQIDTQVPSPEDGRVAPGTAIGVWLCDSPEPVLDLTGFWYSNTPNGYTGQLQVFEEDWGGWSWVVAEGLEAGNFLLHDDPNRVCGGWTSVTHPELDDPSCGTLIWNAYEVIQIEWDDGMWFWRGGFEPNDCTEGQHCIEF